MNSGAKRELQRLGEEAIYSAKGHFKTADCIGMAVIAYVTVPLLTSLVIFIFNPIEFVEKLLALLGAGFSVLAISSAWANRSDKAERVVKGHMGLGNKYLELYKEMREAHSTDEVAPDAVSRLRHRLSALDNETSKTRIGLVGRFWAKWTLTSEVDVNWMREDV